MRKRMSSIRNLLLLPKEYKMSFVKIILGVKWILLRIGDHYSAGKSLSRYLAEGWNLKYNLPLDLEAVMFISMWDTAIKVLLP